jgi:hypothetical protein
MTSIGPFGDPYKLSKPQLDTGTTSANPDVVPEPNPNVVPKKPPANDEFISRGLGPTLPKQKINDLGWESLEGTELLPPAKSDAGTSDPRLASKEEEKLVTAALTKYEGPDAWRVVGISNFA